MRPWFIGAGSLGALAVIVELWRRARPKRVFVSYDHSEDAKYRRLLEAWSANASFKFSFDERSPKEPIDSKRSDVIKAALTKKMKESEYLLVIVGARAHTSKWMAWEIARAQQSDVNLRLAVVKIDRSFATPAGLRSAGAAWAYGFTRDGILTALRNAGTTTDAQHREEG